MTERNKPPQGYQKIDPDDFDYFEEGYIKKGGGGGSGAKSGGRKGLKDHPGSEKRTASAIPWKKKDRS